MCAVGHSFIRDCRYREALSLAGTTILHGQVLSFLMLMLAKDMVFVSFHDIFLWWVWWPWLWLLLHLRELQAALLLPLPMILLARIVLLGGVAIIRREVIVH